MEHLQLEPDLSLFLENFIASKGFEEYQPIVTDLAKFNKSEKQFEDMTNFQIKHSSKISLTHFRYGIMNPAFFQKFVSSISCLNGKTMGEHYSIFVPNVDFGVDTDMELLTQINSMIPSKYQFLQSRNLLYSAYFGKYPGISLPQFYFKT